MKLCHGTSSKHLEHILTHGLQPRGKGRGNWKHSVDSHPDVVYLSSAYALYFAHVARQKGEDMLIVEIDTYRLNPFQLVPDEDFLEQATRMQKDGPCPQDKSVAYRTKWYRRRLLDFQHAWVNSVEYMGNCGHMGPIPPSAITRYSIIPGHRATEIVLAGCDPSVSIMNFKLLKQRYLNWTRWAFRDPLNETKDLLDSTFMQRLRQDDIKVVML